MFSVLSDAVCVNKHMNPANSVGLRAALSVSKQKAAGCYEGLPPSSSSAELFQPGWQHELLHCLTCMSFVNVQCTSGSNLGPT